MVVLICLMTSAITARNARKWVREKSVLTRAHWKEDNDVLQNSFGLRLANSTVCFPFEAYLDSPGRTQHDQRRLVPSALFPDKSDGLGKWSMLRVIKNTIARARLLSGYR